MLQSITERVCSWAEGCLCHNHVTGDTVPSASTTGAGVSGSAQASKEALACISSVRSVDVAPQSLLL
eukprot:5890242-Prorocentrum_lima.AAC.1